MKEIKLFFNEAYLKYGIRQYVTWNPDKAPHICIFGTTGSGKTVASKLLLARIAKCLPDMQLYVNDFKGDSDFSFGAQAPRFAKFMECEQNFESFYQRFMKRQSGEDTSRNMLLCYFDEWASYTLNIDKKKSEEEKKKLATLLMLGRSFNVHVILSQQRMDAVYFANGGSRDQLNVVISLSNLSAEGKEMFFREFKDQIKPDRRQGTGYMITNGTDFTPIQVPFISDMTKIDYYIKEAVCR